MTKHFSTSSPDTPWDTIVIGSGMGGMTCAALLSQLGHRVLLLEKHYVPGGFTHTFKRKKWHWDVGVHAVGEVSDRSLVGRFLDRVTAGRLSWSSLGPVYDEFHYPGGFRIDFPNERQQFIDNLSEAFPEQRGAIADYISEIKRISGAMRGYYLSRAFPRGVATVTDRLLARDAQRYFAERTANFLARITDDEKLRSVFAAQWGYHGSPPSRSSLAMHALVVRHFWYGGYYPEGGSKKIADSMLEVVADAGGWTRIRATVESVVVERSRAIGVRLESGEVIRAKRVVSAAGAIATVNRLLPEAVRGEEWARSIASLNSSPAHVCLYMGFKGDIRAEGAGSANKWFYDTWSTEATQWDALDEASRAPVLYTSFPSLKDPKHEPGDEQLHTGEVVTFVPYDQFAPWAKERWRKRGEDYDALKTELSGRMLSQLLEQMPGLEKHLEFTELSTPISTEHFTSSTRGAIYGIEPTPERYANPWLRPRTPLRGLFLAGCDVSSPGVVGAMVGGVLAALAIEPRRVFGYLRRL